MRLAPRFLTLSALLAAAVPLAAQDYTGTYVVRAPAGNLVTLTLQQNLKGKIRGELSGNGTVVQIDGRLDPGGTMVGTATSNGQSGFAAASLKGDSLQFMIADFGPDGKPNFATAQAVILFRAGSPLAPKGGAKSTSPPAVNQGQPGTVPSPDQRSQQPVHRPASP